MSFNVRGSFRDRVEKNAWRNRAALNLATIGRCAPDVIGLQECQRGNLRAYRKNLPRYARIRGPRSANRLKPDSTAILSATHRSGLLDSIADLLNATTK